MKRLILVLILFVSIAFLSAEEIIATNSWTAAFARAAGVENINQIAPIDSDKPEVYEVDQSDIKLIQDSDYLIYGESDLSMLKLFNYFGKTAASLVQIKMSYKPEDVIRAITILSSKFGDGERGRDFLESYNIIFSGAMEFLNRRGLLGASVIVHYNQIPLIEALGFNIIGVFGPAPVQPGELRNYRHLEPKVIIDNDHNPMGIPISDVTGVPRVSMRNFPGGRDSQNEEVPISLDGVLQYNLEKLIEALID